MRPTDLATPEEWKDIQSLFAMVTGLTSVTFDLDANPVTQPDFQNSYCARVKATETGAALCKEAHKAITNEVLRTGKPVVGRCRAGLVKVVVPIRIDGEIVGVTGGCGVYLKTEGLDRQALLGVGERVGFSQQDVMELAETIKGIDEKVIAEEIEVLNSKLEMLVTRYKKHL